jgi:hypothetical protein
MLEIYAFEASKKALSCELHAGDNVCFSETVDCNPVL